MFFIITNFPMKYQLIRSFGSGIAQFTISFIGIILSTTQADIISTVICLYLLMALVWSSSSVEYSYLKLIKINCSSDRIFEKWRRSG